MSAEGELQEKVGKVMAAAMEPSYMSEIARKLSQAFPDESWSVKQVVQAVSMVQEENRLTIYEVGYGDTDGQAEGSPKYSLDPSGGITEQKDWEPYTIVHNETQDLDDVDPEIRELLNPTISPQDKIALVNTLTGEGNRVSKDAETIMQDAMVRQFREYSDVFFAGYNDPGIDFFVIDDNRRDFGLAVEVTVRYENPVDGPYLDSKQDKAMDKDLDLVILGPAFTETLRDRFENRGDGKWHAGPEEEITHLHKVPNDRPEAYSPFDISESDENTGGGDGFPIIVPDSDRVRNKLRDTGHVGDSYPVVDTDAGRFLDALDSVGREYDVITESEYRNQLREAIEPLLHEFGKPYKIEQWLIDTYWDSGMTTSEVGKLAGTSGRTIRRWLSEERWDIVTRGTGTNLNDDVLEIWKMMYRGEDPFPKEMTGYEIQAMFNRNPFYTIGDWERWYSLSEKERANVMSRRSSPQDNISYTIMLGSDSRLFPSYSFIINKLRDSGIEIREGFFGETGTVYPTGLALEYMLNRQYESLGKADEVGQRDVVEMRSSLEVETAEWLSENGVPFGYEPFQVPSTFDTTGGGFNSLQQVFDSVSQSELEAMWRRIYNKHNLGSEGDIGVEEGLQKFNKTAIVPDFALYADSEVGNKEPDWEGWTQWTSILEVAGAYGVGMIQDWSGWYRVSGVAYKELSLKAMGLWDDSYFVVPDGQGVSDEVRSDDHYIVVNPSQMDAGLDVVGDRLGV